MSTQTIIRQKKCSRCKQPISILDSRLLHEWHTEQDGIEQKRAIRVCESCFYRATEEVTYA